MASTDGFCSIVTFSKGEIGEVYKRDESSQNPQSANEEKNSEDPTNTNSKQETNSQNQKLSSTLSANNPMETDAKPNAATKEEPMETAVPFSSPKLIVPTSGKTKLKVSFGIYCIWQL